MRVTAILAGIFTAGLAVATVNAQTPVGPPTDAPFNNQDYQRPEKCLPCHQRQYDELRSAVKSGYRNVSPLFNGLELSANFLNGGLLRPVYSDSTKLLADGTALNSNLFTTPQFTQMRQIQAGFCFTCHNPHVERMGNDPNKREVPELAGLLNDFQPEQIRPLRDYHLVDAQGNQILPDTPGGAPPPGALPSLGAAGITCDLCHNVNAVDLTRSFQGDGFANTSLQFNHTVEKVGPFAFPVAVKDNFHVASNDIAKISLLRSSAFCNACHDVRVPLGGEGPGNLQHYEFDVNPGGGGLTYFRLENLSSEWQTGAYNSANNPFGQVVRCQDCHMSQFPFAGDSTYQAGDMTVTSPTPGVFAQDYAAVQGVATDQNYPLMKRNVVNHYFTGVDVPILGPSELAARLGDSYPDPYVEGVDAHGFPKSIAARREALLKAAVRVNLDKTDASAQLGQDFTVRVESVALTGHRFPAGFSQERTTYIQLSVTDDNGFLLYQSGYQVDKPHPDTGETQLDGSLDDEDLEHIHAVVDPGRHTDTYSTGAATNGHTNQIFELGPDDGPELRVYSGVDEGLVLFRNELTHVFLPGQQLGRTDGSGNPVVAASPHYEETFSAAFANTVDNFRSLRPLVPRTFRYKIHLPSAAELKQLGMDSLQGPLHVHAQINYEHFPPLFLRFLARTTGPDGPSGHDLQLLTEQSIDNYLRTVRNLASAEISVNLEQQQ
ncbi:MAG TPA: hypothetical protein VGV35_11520 [Bryobacteraceae bacterium]|nr:hypothetical protein [Bryobacteraceae bacterium]